jgi:hypothetical protein
VENGGQKPLEKVYNWYLCAGCMEKADENRFLTVGDFTWRITTL